MQLTRYFPGLIVAALASLSAAFLSEHYRAPLILMGLLLGFAMNFVSADARTHPGLDLAGRTLLRIGIALLGLQVTFADFAAGGISIFGAVILVMAAGMLAAMLAARLFGQSPALGFLAGGATAICGASALLALYGVLGRDRISQACFSLILMSVTLASALATIAYPIIATAAGLDAKSSGFLMGASIHDVAQALGAGYSVSTEAGDQATIVKLMRVTLLAPVVAFAALAFPSAEGEGGARPFWKHLSLPWFIVAFLALVAIGSVVHVPDVLRNACLTVSKALLVLAVAATAMRASPQLMLTLSWKTAMPVAAASVVAFASAFVLAMWVL